MLDTILLDLDGTLLKFSQEAFLNVYLAELKKVFVKLEMDTKLSIKALLDGTEAMIANDGSMLNAQRFWEKFATCLGLTDERCKTVEAACNGFYANEFNIAKSVMEPNDISNRLVKRLTTKGYNVVLATNPLFPDCAVTTRLDWIDLLPQDFKLITHYANSTYCKPNIEYYREVFAKIGKEPTQCLMAGNSPTDDMCVGSLGTETFLVTDYIENKTGVDITAYRHGTLAELETYLEALPAIMR